MEIKAKKAAMLELSVEAAVMTVFEDDACDAKILDKVDAQVKEILSGIVGKDFRGKKNEILVMPTLGKIKPQRIALAGLGKRAQFKLDGVRQIAGVACKALRAKGLKEIAWCGNNLSRLPGLDIAEIFQAFAEGAHLGLYRFDKFKTSIEDKEPKPELQQIAIALHDDKNIAGIAAAIEKGTQIATAVNFTRDLVNAPANTMTPTMLAAEATRMARSVGGGKIRCKVLSKQEIQRLGMNALIGVSKGSDEEPKFVVLEYRGGKASEHPVVLIGKGITFDSGGISIKPAEGMDRMKYDMAGGAAVLGTLNAVARLALPVNVVGLVPACENLPSGSATKPGDVVKALNGKTIEILNTDAEGRLILADALSYAARYKPEAAIDLATLTGACVVALGTQTCGLLGNDAKLIAGVEKAADASQERAWQLPLWEEYDEYIKSDVADVKNIGEKGAGTITAAAFLKKFVDGYPWVHLDIAGVAWEDSEKPYRPKGASGFGVRLLTTLLEQWSKAKKHNAGG